MDGALARLKARRARHAACASEADNDAYLQRQLVAFSDLGLGSVETSAQQQTGGGLPEAAAAPLQLPQPRAKAVSAAACSSAAARSSSPRIAARAAQRHEPASLAPCWRTGPLDAAGVAVQLSERPLLCSASLSGTGGAGGSDVVVGSSDHALYVLDPLTGQRRRTLFTKTAGHSDWVSCVCALPGGRVLSGGTDGRLWLWPAAGAAGSELQGAHAGPVSQVAVLAGSSSSGGGGRQQQAAAAAVPCLAASCSYDRTVKLWDVAGRRGAVLACMTGHAAAVLELAVQPGSCHSTLLTGDRKGGVIAWDPAAAASSWGVADAHAGHITSLAWLQPQDQQQQQQQHDANGGWLALSGGQDGTLRAWDCRSRRAATEQALHIGPKGCGAVTSLVPVAAGARQLLVTAGADGTLRVLDPARSFEPLHAPLRLTDFPYACKAVGGGLVACGCGDGSVHVVDAARGTTLYALGAGRAAVRALEVGPARLVAAGDDGCVVAYAFA